MNYFIGSLYGDYDAYINIKKQLNLKPIDHLWILGDVLDSNLYNPQGSIDIILDLQYHSNIHLILGDHEFYHIMRYISEDDENAYESWMDMLCHLEISGEPLADYFEQNTEIADDIFPYLIQNCEISQMVTIGSNYFYLCHGFPAKFNGNLSHWQLSTATNEVSDHFIDIIQTDQSIEGFNMKDLNEKNCFVICSHQDINELEEGASIYHKNGVFLLGESKPNEYIPVLAIDAAGYFVKNIMY